MIQGIGGKTHTNSYLSEQTKKGVDSWKFLEALYGGRPVVRCFVFSDGTKAHRMTPLEFDSHGSPRRRDRWEQVVALLSHSLARR